MSDYTIVIARGAQVGNLTYQGNQTLWTLCYWNLKKRIPARTYEHCSATTMKKSGRKAIWIPCVPGFKEIFVHEAAISRHLPLPGWSKGCIVVKPDVMRRIWEDVKEKDAWNVTVIVEDSVSPPLSRATV